MKDRVYSEQEVLGRLSDDLAVWRVERGHLVRRYATKDWRGAVLLANTVAQTAEAAWHHPQLVISWGTLEVRLRTHSADGITEKDFELARRIEQLLTWKPAPGDALEGDSQG